MSNEEYKRYTSEHMPRSKSGRNALRAFLVGGLICAIGEGLTLLFASLGADEQTASCGCSVSLIFIGALLTGTGVYDKLARFGGAGTLVPITGFANSVVAPALEFKTEGYITGTAAKMFVISGPVIVFGMSAGVVYGLLLTIFT